MNSVLINSSNETSSPARFLLDASIALVDAKQTEQKVDLHSQILNHYISRFGNSSLHSLRQGKLRSKLNLLDLRRKKALELSNAQSEYLGNFNADYIQKRILEVKQRIDELEGNVIPALCQLVLTSSGSQSSTKPQNDPLNPKLDELYIDLKRIGFESEIHKEGLLTQAARAPASPDTTSHDFEASCTDDTLMDSFVDWDGGIPAPNTTDEINANDPPSLQYLAFHHCSPSLTLTDPGGAMSGFDDLSSPSVVAVFADAILPSHAVLDSHINLENLEDITYPQIGPGRGSMIPEYVAPERKQFQKLEKENEYRKAMITGLRNQILNLKNLSDERRKILSRTKAQLRFIQSPQPARKEWLKAAQVITNRIIEQEIIPILGKLAKEAQAHVMGIESKRIEQK
ncbi:hypothetical protein J3R30DRAFT_3449524 [Lentinula aciculospora]|uniref:Uncharacterized protein n=1 Tax=Lentinula aciculospora TaxID=153920 RepID=A0A9W9AJX6_9AGAR|nr:hypothetical protein J3R30DRAFT_3449524 [Lentinula aciculospora]